MKIITIATTLSLFLLASCGPDFEAQQAAREQGVKDATSLRSDIQLQYMQCYGLDNVGKGARVSKLNTEHISPEFHQNYRYIYSFQHKAEKLGFEKFINGRGLPCNYIEKGPKFIKAIKGYIALCDNNNPYYLKFYQDEKRWALIK